MARQQESSITDYQRRQIVEWWKAGVPSGAIQGQAVIIDMGSPSNPAPTLEPVQLFLVQSETFDQSAEIPDEPILVKPTLEEELTLGAAGRGERQLALEAIRTHYQLLPFRMTVRGLLMEGQSIEEAEQKYWNQYPGNKIDLILRYMQGMHLVGYSSTTTISSGMGTGLIKDLVIRRFIWEKDNRSDNVAEFELEFQKVQAARGALFAEKAKSFIETGLKILGGVALGVGAALGIAAALGLGGVTLPFLGISLNTAAAMGLGAIGSIPVIGPFLAQAGIGLAGAVGLGGPLAALAGTAAIVGVGAVSAAIHLSTASWIIGKIGSLLFGSLPWQRWQSPIPLAQPDGTLEERLFDFEIYWNDVGQYPVLSIGQDGKWVARDIKLVLWKDALQEFRHDPRLEGLAIVPISKSGRSTTITVDNLQDDVELIVCQVARFNDWGTVQAFHEFLLNNHPFGLEIS